LAVTDWRLRRWRLWFLALSNAPQLVNGFKQLPQKLNLFRLKRKPFILKLRAFWIVLKLGCLEACF